MTKHSLSAVVAAALLSCGLPTTSASAADLGGSCCADLEERVAELEATTARKGTRKVSLTVTGLVEQQIMYFDDDVESNTYITSFGTQLATNFTFTGQAQIAPGWTTGFVLKTEAITAEPVFVNQNIDDNNASTDALLLDLSNWFITSDRLGKLTVGLASPASDNTGVLVDLSGSLSPANVVLFESSSFFVRSDDTGRRGRDNVISTGLRNVTFGDTGFCHTLGLGIGSDCNGLPQNVVRYDSPTFKGFNFSSTWGVDDMWDVAARYAAEWNGVKLSFATSYVEQHDENPLGLFGGGPLVDERDSGYFQAGLYLQHVPSGLFFYSYYGAESNDAQTDRVFGFAAPDNGNISNKNGDDKHKNNTNNNAAVQPMLLSGGNDIPDNDNYYLKAGLRRMLNPLGATVFYAEYSESVDMLSPDLIDGIPDPRPAFAPIATATTTRTSTFAADGSELRRYGVGIVQEIDAAAMFVFLKYRNIDAEVDGTTTTTTREKGTGKKDDLTTVTTIRRDQSIEFDDIHFIVAGAAIKF